MITERWSSRMTFFFAAIGVAVGLGNIWRFPYIVGNYGGGAFVLVYLGALVLIGFPLLALEMVLGKETRGEPVAAFAKLAREHHCSPKWRYYGWLTALIMIVVLSIYSVVAGWIIAYTYLILQGDLPPSIPALQQYFRTFSEGIYGPLIGHTLYTFSVFFILSYGFKKGLERACQLLMPVLFILLLGLLGYVVYAHDIWLGITFMFWPDFKSLTSVGVLEAVTHACYTLTVGGGVMIVYGSFMEDRPPIILSAIIIAVLDTIIAIVAGLILFSILLSQGLAPDSGPGLAFSTLPAACLALPGGSFLGATLFIVLLLAALTSSVAQGETILVHMRRRFNNKTLIVIPLLIWAIGALIILSMSGIWGGAMDAANNLISIVLLPMSLFLLAIFSGWCLPVSVLEKHMTLRNAYFIRQCLRYIIPISLIILMFDAWLG